MTKEFIITPALAKEVREKRQKDKNVALTFGEKCAFVAEYYDLIRTLDEEVKNLIREIGERTLEEAKRGLGYDNDDDVIVINTKGEKYCLSASESTKFDYDKVKTLFETAPDSVPDAAKKPGLQNSAAIKKLWQSGIIPADWCEEVVTYSTKLKAVKVKGGE